LAKKSKTPARRGSIFVISAPSGSGKSTLVKRLMASDSRLCFSISYTTREPRGGEIDGRDYFFVSRRIFEGMARRGEFVEWANVYGHCYGTATKRLRAAQDEGKDIVLDIDVQGHRQVREKLPEAVSVFIVPPSFDELARRLRDRCSDSEEAIERRLNTACAEIGRWREYDYLVVNDRLQPATEALKAIVRATRFRRANQAGRMEEIIDKFGG
jgi:guanylate kinase